MAKRRILLRTARVIGSGLLLCLGLLVVSCATKAEAFKDIDKAVHDWEFQKAADALRTAQEQKKPLYSEKDSILLFLDKGMLEHYARNYAESAKDLQEAERLIAEAYTKSVTQEVGSYMVNDNTRDYPGEDYEDIYINAFNALNYYFEENMEGAMVEIRRMNEKLKALATKYDVELSEVQKKALEDGASEVPPGESTLTKFNDSALARYLGMLFYRGIGQPDDARIDRDWLLAAMANAPNVYSNPVPKSISEELDVPRGMARLNVIAFSGLSPLKQEEVTRIMLPVGGTQIKITVPIMVRRPSEVASIKITVDGKEIAELELLEDIEAVAIETFRSRAHLIYTKTVLRATVKAAVAAASQVAGENVGGNVGLALQVFSLGAKIFNEASEQADIRISRYFPGKAYVTGVNLTPGTHSIKILFYNRAGRVIAETGSFDYDVEEGKLNLIKTAGLM